MRTTFRAVALVGLLFVLLEVGNHRPASTQALPGLSVGPLLPATCMQGASYLLTSGAAALYVCTTANTWATISASGDGVPAGAIVFVASGSCPTGYSEVAALNGRMTRGTTTANGNVGTTGGSDSQTPTFTGSQVSTSAITAGTPAGTNTAPALTMNSYTPAGANGAPALTMNSYTPTGSNAAGTVTPLGTIAWPAGVPTHSGITATFAGNALGTHAHELPWQIPSTTTIRQIAVAAFGTGTNRAATAVSAAGVANTTSAAVALSQAVTAGTPAGSVTVTNQGTIAWPAGVPTLSGSSSATSAQTFTGQAATLTGSVAAPTFTGQAATLTGSIVAPVFSGSALATHQHTATATGSISAVDTKAAYINLIGCSKS